MKSLWDFLQAIMFVIVVGAILFIIPFLGIIIGLAAFVAIVYIVIQEERERPP